MAMTEAIAKVKWKKAGVRFFESSSSAYNAMIFGAPAPHSFWAWAVWSHKKAAEGVAMSLAAARQKANDKIREAEFMGGM